MVIQDSDFNWDHPTDEEWMDACIACLEVRSMQKESSVNYLLGSFK